MYAPYYLYSNKKIKNQKTFQSTYTVSSKNSSKRNSSIMVHRPKEG